MMINRVECLWKKFHISSLILKISMSTAKLIMVRFSPILACKFVYLVGTRCNKLFCFEFWQFYDSFGLGTIAAFPLDFQKSIFTAKLLSDFVKCHSFYAWIYSNLHQNWCVCSLIQSLEFFFQFFFSVQVGFFSFEMASFFRWNLDHIQIDFYMSRVPEDIYCYSLV